MPRDVDGDLESLVAQLSEGTAEERGQAAEKLFNKAADDEEARQSAAAVGVIQPLVCMHSFFCHDKDRNSLHLLQRTE